MFEFISSSKIPRLFALAVTLAVSGCVGLAKPYRVVLKELPEKQRIGLLDPVLTTDPEYNDVKFSDAGLVERYLPVQWKDHSEKMMERWQDKGVRVKRIIASLKKVPSFEYRPTGTDHRKGQKYAYDVREIQNLAKSHAVDLIIIPVYQYTNIENGRIYITHRAYCEGVPFSEVQLWFLVIRANGDLVAASPDFSVPFLFSRTLNTAESDFMLRCHAVPAQYVDFTFPLGVITTIEDAIR